MILKTLMKNPILVIGIILFTLFINQVLKKEKWGIFSNDRLVPTSCRAALVRIDKHIPGNWKTECKGNILNVYVKESFKSDSKDNLKTYMYRQLANHMSHIAKSSMVDILEKVDFVTFKIEHDMLTLNAITEGKYIVKLATLNDTQLIKGHLQSTVQVQEVAK